PLPPRPRSTPFPYTTLFRSKEMGCAAIFMQGAAGDQSVNQGTNSGYQAFGRALGREVIKLVSRLTTTEVAKPSLVVKEDRFKFRDRKSTRLNSSHLVISYAV